MAVTLKSLKWIDNWYNMGRVNLLSFILIRILNTSSFQVLPGMTISLVRSHLISVIFSTEVVPPPTNRAI